jgi:YD repeat-containing protein
MKVFFTNQYKQSELVEVTKDHFSIKMVPVNGKQSNGVINKNKITYSDLFENTDVTYKIQGDSVKEDIILKSKPTHNTFSFELKLKELSVDTNEEGTIVFKDEKGQVQWFFERPFMTDASGKYSDQVDLILKKENGKTYVDVVADEEFLNDASTQYPVVIDPTINNWDVLRDNFVSSTFPNSIYSSNTYMNTGYNSYFGSTRSLIRFYLPSLPSDSFITSATFHAYQTVSDSTEVSIDLYRITSNWASSVTWNTQPTIGASPESTTTSNSVNTYWQWEITQLIKDWYNGVHPNYGFMLKQQNETTSPYRSFNTVNSGNNTPRITINYTVDPIGLEDFWSTTEEGVNPANGNLVLQETDVSIPGRGVDVSITRTFNSRKTWHSGMFGYGWWSNVEARLVDSGDGPITLIDGDNTRHIFGQKVGGGYTTPGGIYLDLVKNGDGTYTMTEKDGTNIHFNPSGRIASIVDTNGNTTTFTYNGSGQLIEIEDASGRKTTIQYGANGYVSSITDPANRTTTYEYDGQGNLIKVIDPANFETTYGYDADHNITSITDAKNITTTIQYTDDRVTSISRPITMNGTVETSTTTYSYDTQNEITTVVDGEEIG